MTDTPDTAAPARGGPRSRKGISTDAQAWLTSMGQIARGHRKANGISPAAVAETSGDDVSQIHKMERGELNPTLGRIFPILAAQGLRLVVVKNDSDPANAVSAWPIGDDPDTPPAD